MSRVEFIKGFPKDSPPGSYAKVPDGIDPRGNGYWYVVTPTSNLGALSPTYHTVTEHDDGTITVVPSIICGSYHGWLTNGVWS